MGVGSFSNKKTRGFTIVELLIVIVVIGILAAIVIVAYNGVQQRARDSRRQTDVRSITQALELYYTDNGRYPAGSGSTTPGLNAAWSTTSDASWANLATLLQPYLANVPSDPVSTPNVSVLSASGYNYAYYSDASVGASYCGAGQSQMYILVYRFEGSQVNTLNGACSSNVLGPYANVSNYRTTKL